MLVDPLLEILHHITEGMLISFFHLFYLFFYQNVHFYTSAMKRSFLVRFKTDKSFINMYKKKYPEKERPSPVPSAKRGPPIRIFITNTLLTLYLHSIIQ